MTLEEKNSKPSAKIESYLISIKGGNKERTICLSSGMFRFGVASVIIGGLLLVGTAAFSFYSTMRMQRDASTIREIEQAAELRQEQLLTLSKKAATLSETIQNLAQQEQELRIQAGLNPPKESQPPETPAEGQPAPETPAPPAEGQPPVEAPADNADAVARQEREQRIKAALDAAKANVSSNSAEEHDGQGGPIGELDIAEVSEALDMLEAKVSTRKESLDDFQMALKQRREQMARGAAIAGSYSPNFEGFSGENYNGSVQFDFSNGLPIIPAAGSIPAPGSFPFDPSLVGGSGAADSRIPSIWPTTGVVTSPYGLRWGGTDFHPGMDIANDMGTPIVATADGVVEYAGWNSGGYGNMVDINHGNGIMTRYGHASQVVVSTGQHVKRGQLIAYMGSTGFSTGPHVHYEVHVNGNRVNPISYL